MSSPDFTLPLPSTVDRMLRRPTPALLVAIRAADGMAGVYCRAAGQNVAVARSMIRAVCRDECDTVDAIAIPLRQAVWTVWDDERDAAPQLRGKMLITGCPLGVADACRAAAVIACSLAGMIEPTDDHAAIIETWWREECRKDRSTVSLDFGEIDMRHARSALADRIESPGPRWPGESTPLQTRLDAIAHEVVRDGI